MDLTGDGTEMVFICPAMWALEVIQLQTLLLRMPSSATYPFTHSFSLKDEELPMCIGCNERLIIKHFTCSDCIETRESHFTAQSLRVLAEEISLQKIFHFLKDINSLDRI